MINFTPLPSQKKIPAPILHATDTSVRERNLGPRNHIGNNRQRRCSLASNPTKKEQDDGNRSSSRIPILETQAKLTEAGAYQKKRGYPAGRRRSSGCSAAMSPCSPEGAPVQVAGGARRRRWRRVRIGGLVRAERATRSRRRRRSSHPDYPESERTCFPTVRSEIDGPGKAAACAES